MARILVLSLIFPPDAVSTAQLLGEIAEDLDAAGDPIEVVTTTPHYNHDADAVAQQPLRWRWHRLLADSDYRGIPVTHVRMPGKSGGGSGRIAQWLWFHAASAAVLFARRRSFDAILTVSPPPTVALVAGFFRRYGARTVYAVWELYPEILVSLGVVRRGSNVHRALSWLERKTYNVSDVITTLHQPMRDAVLDAAPEATDKTFVIPTFADTTFLQPGDRDTDLRREFGIGARQVVGYAGNLGASEDLTPVLLAAKSLPEIVFLISGDGTERRRLEAYVAAHQLENVLFTGQLPYRRMPEVTATWDIGLVVLSPGLGNEALPSKVYRIMSCGRPVLAVTEESSPLGRLVIEADAGRVADPRQPGLIAATISATLDDEAALTKMGEAARQTALDRFSREAVTSRYRAALSGRLSAGTL